MPIGQRDIFQAAVQLESDGRKFYLEAAEKSSDELVRRVFESLADEELKHIERLKQIFSGIKPEATAPEEVYKKLRHIFAEAPEDLRRSASAAQNDIEAFRIALEIEEKSIATYRKLAEESWDEELSFLYDTLAGQERVHRDMIENTMEYLEHPVDWFAREEKWIYEGGP